MTATVAAETAAGWLARRLGDLAHLVGGGPVTRAVAAALPELTAAQGAAVARASAQLRMRQRLDPWPRLSDVALCRRLSWQGAEPLRQARATPAAVFLGASLGVPALAERAIRLYGGDPAVRVVLLPGRADPDGEACSGSLLGRLVHGSAVGSHAAARAAFPIFATFEPGGRYRVELQPAIAPEDDPEARFQAALERLERAIRARPEAWPWAEWARVAP